MRERGRRGEGEGDVREGGDEIMVRVLDSHTVVLSTRVK